MRIVPGSCSCICFCTVFLFFVKSRLHWLMCSCFLGSVIMEPRGHARKPICRLLYLASDEVLDEVEALLRKQVPTPNPAVFRNPSGDKSRRPCKICGGQRPPFENAESMQLHSAKCGLEVGHGCVCLPCRWAQRVDRNRDEWPRWESLLYVTVYHTICTLLFFIYGVLLCLLFE